MGYLNKLSGISEVRLPARPNGRSHAGNRALVHAAAFRWLVHLSGHHLWHGYHKRNPKANYHGVQSHASSHLEIGVIITEVILLLGFAFPLWANRVDQFPRSRCQSQCLGRAVRMEFPVSRSRRQIRNHRPFPDQQSKPRLALIPKIRIVWMTVITGSLVLPNRRRSKST